MEHKKNQKIDILVTVDENYLEPLKTMLYSLHQNDPQQAFTIWLIHEKIPTAAVKELREMLIGLGSTLEERRVAPELLKGAPTAERYPKEMYFRLLSGAILPKTLKKVLYLDPDILVINPLQKLWQTDLEGNMFAAAIHAGMTNLSYRINTLRLGADRGYFNSGVMLIDLEKARTQVKLQDIYDALAKYKNLLVLPDQDILNYLYGRSIKEVPEEIWNYDTRQFLSYLTRSFGKYDTRWTMQHTAILHFCGKPKPWEEKNGNKFTILYFHYEQMRRRFEALNKGRMQ
ncbi:MAG: glycosyltransferase family 8 protein [Enterococcaceae bacterium]|jgi:lipopolysaccharide biosynthesis glycosyltransferase|nr:glycosyltransferase family 8 protein [Enterococcaceae bacterium]MCI1918642.1 glycosyltransferase family 8 protein [Enterococcaceae bacterium]